MLKEKNEIAERLHKEELGRIEMEKRLMLPGWTKRKARFNLHFLFNTLNMIACMAKSREEADTN